MENGRWYDSILAPVGGLLIAALMRLLGMTWRIRFSGPNPLHEEGIFVGAQWHRGLLCSAFVFRDRGLVIPVSLSRDGDYAIHVLRWLGFGPSPRGSSSRASRSLLAGLIRAARDGHHVGILPDGPKGPSHEAKPGILALARATGHEIRPVGVAARPCLVLRRSWDRSILPLPFARVSFVFGEPLRIARRSDRHQLDDERMRLQTELTRLEELAEEMLDSTVGEVQPIHPTR